MAFKETKSAEFSIPLPRALDTRIHIRLATLDKAVMVYLTTATPNDASTTPMGSLVYALPDVRHTMHTFIPLVNKNTNLSWQRFNPQQPLATTLFSVEPTLEFTTRLAKLLARKASLPVYVTNSMSFVDAGMGGTVEEEMEALRNIVEVTLGQLRKDGVVSPASS
jgi:flagellar biosynthesis protein FlhB